MFLAITLPRFSRQPSRVAFLMVCLPNMALVFWCPALALTVLSRWPPPSTLMRGRAFTSTVRRHYFRRRSWAPPSACLCVTCVMFRLFCRHLTLIFLLCGLSSTTTFTTGTVTLTCLRPTGITLSLYMAAAREREKRTGQHVADPTGYNFQTRYHPALQGVLPGPRPTAHSAPQDIHRLRRRYLETGMVPNSFWFPDAVFLQFSATACFESSMLSHPFQRRSPAPLYSSFPEGVAACFVSI